MPRVTHFELPADDTDRAAKFYGGVFGWEFQKWEGPMPYFLVMTGPDKQAGINGGMAPRRQPGEPPTIVIDVPSVDDYVTKLQKHGAKIVVPKMAIPTVGWCAYFLDPEGNTLGIFQADESAA